EICRGAEPAPLAAKSGSGPATHGLPLGHPDHRFIDDSTVLRLDGSGHRRGERSLVCGRCWFREPDGRLPAGVRHFLSQPVESLPRARVERQGDHAITDLRYAQATQLPPQTDPWGRWLPGQAIGEEYPAGSAIHGVTLPR